ncbi:MAG TPA: nitroreductase family protein [Spirochaetia bacterium]|nr:nitroreductase family protein [Spirochaetia bacterium]
MELPYNSWHSAITRRRSRRRFDPALPEGALLERMRQVCENFRPFPGVRAALVTQPADDVFKGFADSYGKVKNAPAFIAFIGRRDDPAVQEKVGYLGEGIVLEATSLGLGTCWIGGFFRPEMAASLAGAGGEEIVPAVTPLGRAAGSWTVEERMMSGFGRNHQRKPLAEFVSGLPESDWPSWVRGALEAARLAPSAVNRQPWRFLVETGSVTLAVDSPKDDFHVSRRLDCGIAMLHMELGFKKAGSAGRWEFLAAPRVARFTITGPIPV